MNNLKILQINLQKCKAATLEFCKTMANENFEIALVQEPYNIKKGNKYKIPFTGHFSVIANNDEPILAATIINTKFLDIFVPDKLLTPKISLAKVHFAGDYLTVISIYCPPQENIVNELFTLQTIINDHSNNLILSGDFNCRSVTWNDVITDNRSQYLEEFIISNNLIIQNRPNTSPTFKTPNGQSYIDLTLTSANISNKILQWDVNENLIQSDHNCITFQYENGRNLSKASLKARFFDTNSIDPSTILDPIYEIVNEIETKFPVIISPRKIDEVLNYFQSKLNSLVESRIRPRRKYVDKPEWWDDKVEKARKEYLKQKSRFYRNKIAQDRDKLHNCLKSARTKFHNIIKSSKEAGWKKFLSEDLTSNPWGVTYKLAAEKFHKTDILTSLSTGPNTNTKGVADTLNHLVNNLLPDDDANRNNYQKTLQSEFNSIIPLPHYDTADIDENLLDQIIMKIDNKKAPGPDCLRGKIIKSIYPVIKPFLIKIYSACLRASYFPAVWKKGNLKILIKDVNRPHSDIKNYRPITLLPILGKVFEKIIRAEINNVIPQTHSPKQYGFTAGKSTIDALRFYTGKIRNCNKKYMLTLFIDISGAFDNLWWPALIKSLRNKNIPHNLIALIKSYLTNREVALTSNSCIVKKTLTKGCPQGSVLGPTLWNFMIDDLLDNILLPTNSDIIAYADDIAVTIESDSRIRLLEIAQNVIDSIKDWANTNKLCLSAHKTKILINKSPARVHFRDINIKIDNQKISITDSFKYLGLIIDRKLNFIQHINYVAQKAKSLILALRKKAHVTWDINITKSMHTIYKCAIVPIVSYASEIWINRLSLSKVRRKILSIYGQASRLISRSYVTVSTDAAGIICGILPLDLHIHKTTCLQMLKKQQTAPFLDQIIDKRDFPHLAAIREYLDVYTYDIWLSRWESSEKGRLTHSFIPEPPETPNNSFTFLGTQILTGHGDFGWHLRRIGKSENGNCLTCQQEADIPWHRITDCPDFDEERNLLKTVFDSWPPDNGSTLMRWLGGNVEALEPFAVKRTPLG